MNPYQILGVSYGDSEEAIKRAYRKAAKECHPDTHPQDRGAEERFKEIGEAYRILCDKKKREEYDRTMSQHQAAGKKTARGYRKEAGTQQKVNPMDVSDLFERYMGFKR